MCVETSNTHTHTHAGVSEHFSEYRAIWIQANPIFTAQIHKTCSRSRRPTFFADHVTQTTRCTTHKALREAVIKSAPPLLSSRCPTQTSTLRQMHLDKTLLFFFNLFIFCFWDEMSNVLICDYSSTSRTLIPSVTHHALTALTHMDLDKHRHIYNILSGRP